MAGRMRRCACWDGKMDAEKVDCGGDSEWL